MTEISTTIFERLGSDELPVNLMFLTKIKLDDAGAVIVRSSASLFYQTPFASNEYPYKKISKLINDHESAL